MTVADIVLAAFAITNSVRVVAYLPQILKIAKDNDGAVAVSNGTWALFGVSHMSTVAYALVVLDDIYMTLLFTANLLCCIAIIALTFWKRRRFHALRLDHVLRVERVSARAEPTYPNTSPPVDVVARDVELHRLPQLRKTGFRDSSIKIETRF
jgi:hypothetical protein